MNLLKEIFDKLEGRDRITAEDALLLLERAETPDLARYAHEMRKALHPEPEVTYVVDRNINYTNVCVSKCLFCAFCRDEADPDAYVISMEELGEKIRETLELGGTQILLQGGMHPGLSFDFYLSMLSFIKERFGIHVHGFSPTEICYMSERFSMPVKTVLERLVAAGLDSIPGGGAEILRDRVRKRISPGKCGAREWLEVMETAHRLGLRTTATMMFGHVEGKEDIIEHLNRIRGLQDDTGGFTAFIPWTFQPENTRIRVTPATGVEYLRILAVCRLFLDNIPNIQASWVTQGGKIAQIALVFGANDFGSTMIEENVVAAAGVTYRLPMEEIVRLIEDAGYRAVQRDCFYRPVK